MNFIAVLIFIDCVDVVVVLFIIVLLFAETKIFSMIYLDPNSPLVQAKTRLDICKDMSFATS